MKRLAVALLVAGSLSVSLTACRDVRVVGCEQSMDSSGNVEYEIETSDKAEHVVTQDRFARCQDEVRRNAIWDGKGVISTEHDN